MTTAERPTAAERDALGEQRVTHLLVATAVGVYLLVVLGATTSLLSRTVPCPTWPACNGALVVSPTAATPALLAAWLHRVTALVVGALVVGTAGVAWLDADERVGFAVAVAAVLYPVQVAVGALTAVGGATVLLAGSHLLVAMVIFSSVLVALLWQLEDAVPDGDAGVETADGETISAPESAAASAPSRRVGAESAAGRELDPESAAGRDNVPDRGPVVRARDYLELTKPKLMWLLCLVALAAMGLAAGPSLDPWTAAATLLGGVLAIGASGTFNNVLERDVDRKMSRTDDRPLVEGRIPVWRAVAFGLALAAASVATFLAFVNALAAVLGLLAILFYSVVYTLLLKPNTTQNIVIGGAVGAFPALIGWAAVTNTVGLPAVVLGAVVFLWTPAHFYNLALAYREDYARGGFPMLPVVYGEAKTRRHVLLYFGATMLAAVVLGAITRLDVLYATTSVALGGVFLWAVARQYRERTESAAFRTFHASNAYLGALLLAIVVDTLLL